MEDIFPSDFDEKLNERIIKLESSIRKLTKENDQFRVKINNLELMINKLCNNLNISSGISHNLNHKNISSNADFEEIWLYSVSYKIPTSQILNKLNVKDKDSMIIENSVISWKSEKDMLSHMLRSFQKFKEFENDWETFPIQDLKKYLQLILKGIECTDLVIILRNLPSKNEQDCDQILMNVAYLSSIIYDLWKESNANEGVLALILEIKENIQVLNVINGGVRMIMDLEPLF